MLKALLSWWEYITEGQEYKLVYEHDTVYEIINNNGKKHCLPKGFFEKVE